MITMPALDGCLAGLRARRASCSIFIPYPHIYPSNMPTPLPIMCFKLHRKHGAIHEILTAGWHSLLLSSHTAPCHNCQLFRDFIPMGLWSTCSRAPDVVRACSAAVCCKLQRWGMESCDVPPPPISLITQSHHPLSSLPDALCSLLHSQKMHLSPFFVNLQN